jgi:hypothetical protein
MSAHGPQDRAANAHRRRYRLNGVKEQRRLANALAAIEDNEEAVLLALKRITSEPSITYLEVKAALRLLVEGEPR